MKRILSVVLLAVLMVPVAWALPAVERDGERACPVEATNEQHGLLNRLTTAQSSTGLFCVWGPYWCNLVEPLPVRSPCCCDTDGDYSTAEFCGVVETQAPG